MPRVRSWTALRSQHVPGISVYLVVFWHGVFHQSEVASDHVLIEAACNDTYRRALECTKTISNSDSWLSGLGSSMAVRTDFGHQALADDILTEDNEATVAMCVLSARLAFRLSGAWVRRKAALILIDVSRRRSRVAPRAANETTLKRMRSRGLRPTATSIPRKTVGPSGTWTVAKA